MRLVTITLLNEYGTEYKKIEKYLDTVPEVIVYDDNVWELTEHYPELGKMTYKVISSAYFFD